MSPTDDDTLHFGCPQCLTRLKASSALAGTRRRCPYCQMAIEIPRQTRITMRDEEYPFQQETGPLPADQSVYILVVCPVCHTRMHVTEDQVGQKIACPDCGTSMIVDRPAEGPPKKRFRSAEEIGDYPLADEVDRGTGGVPAAEQSYVAMLCPVCHTRLHATLDQVGGKLICPDCGTAAVVPPPPPPRRKIDPMAGAGQGYRLANRDEKDPTETTQSLRPSSPTADQPSAPTATEPHLEPYYPRPALPRRPFLVGTFSFPLSSNTRAYALLVAAWGMLPVGLAWQSAKLGDIPAMDTWLGSAMLGAAAVILAVMWFAFAAACALAVVRDTANGCDQIQDWPGLVFIDWIGEPLYLFNSLCVSVLPGLGLAWLLARSGQPGAAAAPAGAFFLFPIVLLSMLENDSPLGAISLPVCRTLWTARRGWAAFYLTSAALLAAAGAVATTALAVGPLCGIVAATLTMAAVWLIYFRLLGRLAWYCADRAAHEEPEEIEPDDDEGLDDDNSYPEDDEEKRKAGQGRGE